jgi:hypothetical protein
MMHFLIKNCVANPQNVENVNILVRVSSLLHINLNHVVFKAPSLSHGNGVANPKSPFIERSPTTKNRLKVLCLQAKFSKP